MRRGALAWFLVTFVHALRGGAIGLLALALIDEQPASVLLPLLLGAMVTTGLPWPLTRRWVRRGRVRAAWFGTRSCALYPWGLDQVGGAGFTAATALVRQAAPEPADAAWLAARLEEGRVLTAAALGAWGLLAAARGQRQEARRLIAATWLFDRKGSDDLLRVRTVEWLVADAAEHGEWAALVRDVAGKRLPDRRVKVLVGVAGHLAGQPTVGVERLRRDHRRLRRHERLPAALLEAAAAPPPPSPVADLGGDPLTAALRATLAAARHEAADPGAVALRGAAAAWSRAIDAGAVPATLVPAVVDDLAHAARRLRLPLGELGESPLAEQVDAQRREELLASVELSAQVLHQRIRAERWLPRIDEVREWLLLAEAYREAVDVGGPDARRLLFRPVADGVLRLAVDLFNRRKERWLGNAMFRWLKPEAIAVGDEAYIEALAKNLTLSPQG